MSNLNTIKYAGVIGSLWGVTGVCLLLLSAIVRLSQIGLEILTLELAWYHWLVLLANVLFMAYSEGYRGFQLQFSPRVAARCLYLSRNPRILHIVFAPLFCMGFFHTTRRRQFTTLIVTLLIILIVNIAHLLPQPWRGILDLGVVAGLLWGLSSFIYYVVKAFSSAGFSHSPELPC